jgi:hypothetical protein
MSVTWPAVSPAWATFIYWQGRWLFAPVGTALPDRALRHGLHQGVPWPADAPARFRQRDLSAAAPSVNVGLSSSRPRLRYVVTRRPISRSERGLSGSGQRSWL